MKKSNLLFIAAGALMMASCSSEELVNPTGNDGNVTFTVTLPGSMNSRAFADGLTADDLEMAVYDASNDAYVFTPEAVKFGNSLRTTVTLNLSNGRNYKIAFFAHKKEGSAYSFNPESKTITVNYGAMNSNYNTDSYDCFYTLFETGTITGPITKDVTLTRPVAQINWGTSDHSDPTVVAADNYGAELANLVSKVTTKAYTTFNMIEGDVDASSETNVTLSYLGCPAKAETFPVTAEEGKSYRYLSMQYLLVPKASSVLDLTLEVANDAAATAAQSTVKVTNAPVQANYRTNIFGALLTTPETYNVIKNEQFDGKNDIEIKGVEPGKATYNDKTYNSIQEAISAVTGESAIIYVGDGTYPSTDLNIPAAQNQISSLTIVGQGKNTVFEKNAGQNIKSNIDLTLSNLTIRTNASNYNGFYHSGSELYDRCYIENALFLYGTTAKFQNCTLTVDEDKLASSYNVWCYGAKEVTFENCQFNSAKSILVYCENAALNQTVNVNNCVFNGKELKDGKAAIEVDCHRLGADYKYTINLSNNKAAGYDGGNLSGKQLWNVKDGEKFEVFENGVEVKQGLTTPDRTGNIYHVNTAEGLVKVSDMVNNGYYKDGEKRSELFAGKTIILTANIDMAGIDFTPIGAGMDANPSRNFSGTFDGNGKTISNLKASDTRQNYAAAGLFGGLIGKVQNLTLTNVDIYSTHYAGGIAGYVDNENGSLIDNCKVIGGKIVSVAELIGESWDNGDKAGGILGYGCISNDKVTNCTVENLTIKAYRDCGAVVGFANNAANVTGNSAKNITLVWDNTHNYKNYDTVTGFGAIIGRVNSGEVDASNSSESVTLPE